MSTTPGAAGMAMVLDAARWAPSGDNSQPWHFEIVDPMTLVVHGHDTRAHCVYDLQGEASQLSIGALLETMDIAASTLGWTMACIRRLQSAPDRPTFDVQFSPGSRQPDPLAAQIRRRSVQRRPMPTRALTSAEKQTLQTAVEPLYSVAWIDGPSGRRRAARLMFQNAKLRLTMREAFEVHRSVIEWGARESQDKVPDQALGVNRLTLRMMRFGLGSWGRVQFANRFLAGTWAPRIEMDLIPALACSAHLVIRARREPQSPDDFIAAGRAVQRLWLTATSLGLWQQPEMTPLIFARYVRQGLAFSRQVKALTLAGKLSARLEQVIGAEPERAVWMGRIGEGPAPTARSVRLPLEVLTRARGPT